MTIVEAAQTIGISTGGIAMLIGAVSYALKERSRADRIRAETDAATQQAMNATLASFERRLDECHERHDRMESESRQREEACEERTREALRKVAELSARVDRMTPQPMRKVEDA